MNLWMKELAEHFEKRRQAYPRDKLLVVFDIDGTILDMRHMILYVLKSYDAELGTRYFEGLDYFDIDFHEDHVSSLLERLSIQAQDKTRLLNAFEERLISATAFPHSQQPFHGALDVVRWFQGQPNTFVGLNTGRPESLRTNTLNTLNSWGKQHDVVFLNELLYMRSLNTMENIAYAKVAGIDYFKRTGYRIIAFLDNEPENLRAVGEADQHGEILLLHADTIFKSDINNMPQRVVKGSVYDFTQLIAERMVNARSDDDGSEETDSDFRRTA